MQYPRRLGLFSRNSQICGSSATYRSTVAFFKSSNQMFYATQSMLRPLLRTPCNHPPRCQGRHRRHRSQDQPLHQLNRSLQDYRRRPGTCLRHPRWPAPSRPTITPSDRPHQSVLNSFSTTSPPSHVTVDVISPPPERLEIDQITEHQLVRETHWAGLLSPSWEDERDLRPIGPTSFAIGRAPPRTTARPTANTANESPHGRGCTFRLKCF